MTTPSTIRIFFALDLPLAAKKKVSECISMLKKKSRANEIRWTKTENLHVTLQFLAKVDRAHLPALIQHVRDEIRGKMEGLVLSFGDIHLFPNPSHPRVIVLDILPLAPIAALSNWIAVGIKKMDYPVEERLFRAHLTIGRIKKTRGLDLQFLNECRLPSLENINIHEVVLFQSNPQPEGSQYIMIEKIRLRQARAQ